MLKSLIVALCLFGGIALGVGCYTFIYAKGASYLTNDSAACANCHVMNEQYAAWMKGTHRHVAACNDCHTPPEFLAKYATKALNGYFHSWAFTMGGFHEPIRITARNRKVTEQACRHCHEAVFQTDEMHSATAQSLNCISCHRNVGHMH